MKTFYHLLQHIIHGNALKGCDNAKLIRSKDRSKLFGCTDKENDYVVTTS